MIFLTLSLGVDSFSESSPDELLRGENVFLRGVEPGDLEFLYRWENDPAVWEFGDCGAPENDSTNPTRNAIGATDSLVERFSRNDLRLFIENQRHDIYVTGQTRLVICRVRVGKSAETAATEVVGFVDLFDFDPATRSAGVGILICEVAHRRKGYGLESLRLAANYAKQFWGLNSLWCNVDPANIASLGIFSAAGFERVENVDRINALIR
jgi:diamine N-acetyltransferase